MGVAANTIARQCLEAGLLDEVVVDLVPIVMGKGGHTPASYLRITDSCWLTRRHSPGVSRQPAASVGSDVAYVASALKMISGRILLVGNIFPIGRPRSRPAAGTIAMSSAMLLALWAELLLRLGDPLDQPGFRKRCQDRHERVTR